MTEQVLQKRQLCLRGACLFTPHQQPITESEGEPMEDHALPFNLHPPSMDAQKSKYEQSEILI